MFSARAFRDGSRPACFAAQFRECQSACKLVPDPSGLWARCPHVGYASFACLLQLRIRIKIKSPRQKQLTPMTDDPDLDPASAPDKLKGPGGMSLRQIHEQVQKSVQRDREAQAAHNSPPPTQSRWQRWVRYVWGRSGRR